MTRRKQWKDRDLATVKTDEWREMAAVEASIPLRRLYLHAVEDIERATVIMPETVRAIRAAWGELVAKEPPR